MDIQDFGGFAAMALFLCCPLIPIYLTLELLNWNQRTKLFLDSWYVYLSWLVSSLIVGILTIYFDGFETFWAVLLVVNTLVVAATLSWTVKAKRTSGIFDSGGEINLLDGEQKIFRTSFFVSTITTLAMIAVFSAATGIGNLIKKNYPKPKSETSFEIYD
jgi:hypothetical protein